MNGHDLKSSTILESICANPKCGKTFRFVLKGRPRKYCRDECRNNHYRKTYRDRIDPATGEKVSHLEYVKRKKAIARKICNG